ncbi:hypothetical protein AAHC03_013718 [Spirometra sp. Aus1]
MKWLKGDVSHVTFVDISSASIDVCKDRYHTLRAKNRRRQIFSADFIVHDCTTPIDFAEKFDLVSCQFSLHYAFGSYSQASSMLRNISSALSENGFFVATLPNAYELVRRFNQVKTTTEGPVTFGNSVYSIKFDVNGPTREPNALPLFGARYTFQLEGVVDCPEYLVHPLLLKTMATELNLTHLVGPLPFPKHLQDETQRNQASFHLLSIMDALESWTDPFQAQLGHSDRRGRTDDGYKREVRRTRRSPSRDRSPIGWRPRNTASDHSDDLSPNCGSVERSVHDSVAPSSGHNCRHGNSLDNRQFFYDNQPMHTHYPRDRNHDDRKDAAWRPDDRPGARDDRFSSSHFPAHSRLDTYNSPTMSNHCPLAGSSEPGAYRHVEEAVKGRLATTNQLIGTISYPEWEVFSLYCIFAFQKTKT